MRRQKILEVARWILGLLYAIYTPFFAIFVLIATPSALLLGAPFYRIAMPLCMGAFALAMLARPRFIRLSAWTLYAVMGLWIIDNVGTHIYLFTLDVPAPGWKPMTLKSAILETLDGGIYWWFVLVPQLICALIATLFYRMWSSNLSLHADAARW
jgi:hypothetical protein